MRENAEGIIKLAAEWLAHGRKVCLATIITKSGAAPREVGAKMVVSDTGETAGSIGGGVLEKETVERARRAIEDGCPAVVDFDLSGESPTTDAICGGRVSVFIEPLGEARKLFVMGAGHVGRALARIARWVGFAVTVIDDREEHLERASLGPGIATFVASPDAWPPALKIDASAFVVICTRGHALDKEWLRAVARANPQYVGMIGSHQKATRTLSELEAEGIPGEFLKRVQSPVGLAIEALTPEEIAVSIVGQLVLEWRRARRGRE